MRPRRRGWWRGSPPAFCARRRPRRSASEHDAVTGQDIISVLTANASKAAGLVARLARDFPREHEPCPIGSDRALDNALITAPEARDPELLKKLDAVAGPGRGG